MFLVWVTTLRADNYIPSFSQLQDKRSNLKTHLEASTEEHLSKTWSKLQKTTNVLEDVEDDIRLLQEDKTWLKRSLKKKHSALKKLDLKNKTLKKEVTKLEKQLEEVKRTAAENQKMISLMKPHVLGPNATGKSKKASAVEYDRCRNPVKSKQKRKDPETDNR